MTESQYELAKRYYETVRIPSQKQFDELRLWEMNMLLDEAIKVKNQEPIDAEKGETT
jgi:hypothetical protein